MFANWKNSEYNDETQQTMESKLDLSTDPKVLQTIDQMKQDYDIPEQIYDLFKHYKSMDSDIVSDKSFFKFQSLNWITKSMNDYNNHGQNHFIDLVLGYQGMGWYDVIAWDKNEKKFFIRTDGGSNGWDRQFNFDYYTSDKFTFSDPELKTKLFDFNEFMNFLKINYEGENNSLIDTYIISRKN